MSIAGSSVDGVSLLSDGADSASAVLSVSSRSNCGGGDAAADEPGYTTDYYSMETAEKRMFLRILNSVIRLFEVARRIALACGVT